MNKYVQVSEHERCSVSYSYSTNCYFHKLNVFEIVLYIDTDQSGYKNVTFSNSHDLAIGNNKHHQLSIVQLQIKKITKCLYAKPYSCTYVFCMYS